MNNADGVVKGADCMGVITAIIPSADHVSNEI